MVKGAELAAAVLDHADRPRSRPATGTGSASRWPCSPTPRSTASAKGKVQAPVRVAVTGRTVGPPLFESLEVLGRDETLRRLRAARARV